MAQPRPRRAIESPVPARREQVVAEGSGRGNSRFGLRRPQRTLIAFATSLALVLGVFGIFGVGSASATTRSRVAVSFSQDRSHAVRLNGATVKGKIYVFVRSSRGLRQVDFYLGNREQKLAPARTERISPFDLAGTARNGTALPYDTRKLVEGSHTTQGGVDLAEWEDLQSSGRLHCR